MSHPTEVHSVEVRSRVPSQEPPAVKKSTSAELTRVESRLLIWDKLIRNAAVVGALLLLLVAMRDSGSEPVQSVFSAVQNGAGMEWDESLGKLSFVSNLLPQSLQAVWNEQPTAVVYAPCSGTVVHAWSASEPYVELQTVVKDIHAAQNGEVMSIAHGMDEELIVRLRHDDGTETLYGNLTSASVEEGAYVYAGDAIGELMADKPLCFELRSDGRSIDPIARMHDAEELWN